MLYRFTYVENIKVGKEKDAVYITILWFNIYCQNC